MDGSPAYVPPLQIARSMGFGELIAGLRDAHASGHVTVQNDGPLSIWCYSRSAVYDRVWTPFTMAARGLILNETESRIVAAPFEKFFNVGERGDDVIPDLPFQTFEKLDGSLIIIFHDGSRWRTATKGSFKSDQAKWAASIVARMDSEKLNTRFTYLAEAIYPENRIVVPYDYEGLVLLTVFNDWGGEVDFGMVCDIAADLELRVAKRHDYSAVSELLAIAKDLPASEEGFVLRFQNGLRMKVKGDQYRRIHAMVSRVTPLALWELMAAGDDLGAMRREIPEEFWGDFDTILRLLGERVDAIVSRVKVEAAKVMELSDKEVGLRLDEFPSTVRSFIFPYRKSSDLMSGKSRQTLFRDIRPTRNELPGYRASSSMNRVMDDA